LNTTAGESGLLISNISDAAEVADSLRSLGLCKDFDTDPSAGRTDHLGSDVADLVRGAFDRQPFVEKGCLPNRCCASNNVTDSIMIERLVPKVDASLR
jgi:hypothetical protein